MDVFYLIFQQTLMVAVAIAVVSLGGMFSERSGVVNIALEGIMVVGAFAGIIFIYVMQSAESTMNPQLMLVIALLISAVVGGIYSLLLSFASINMKADQTIGGTALNIMAPAIALFLSRSIIGSKNVRFTNSFYLGESLALSDIPVIGDLLFKNTYITVYVGIAIWIAVMIVLYKTKFGLRLRACGEHPQAADSVGINVYKMRYAGVTISGVLGGLGGLMLIIVTVGTFSGTVNGYGYLALAVLIFGQWKPKYVFPAAVFFAFMNTLASFNSVIPFMQSLGLSSAVYKMLPYITTLIILAFTSRSSKAPKSCGIPYDQGKR
ncbi:MAG: ABC transporter permease [Bacillota bacterium]